MKYVSPELRQIIHEATRQHEYTRPNSKNTWASSTTRSAGLPPASRPQEGQKARSDAKDAEFRV